MNQTKIGTIQSMDVIKRTAEGFLLSDGQDEILLPHEQVDGEIEEIGEHVTVFLYNDRKKNPVATMFLPEVRLDAYGWAEVAEVVKNLGVFVNIGVDKAFLVSKDHLPLLKEVWPKEGDWLFVSLEKDKKGRVFAEPISEGEVLEDLEKAPENLLNETIVGRIYRSTKAGSFILTEEGYRGFIHPYERKTEPRLGETIEGRIIDVKEDGTLNISLRPLKQHSMDPDADQIYNYLVDHDGVMPFTDKSDPNEIRDTFKISKSAFKRAIGKLMKEDKVIQKQNQTVMKHND
ncbi:CvfB family protein [Halobacillus amylolyticus]|uniref:S1-like domain-containing RNA-binding protein n=1 Tax=Halobacillus amylolyticus TaxID=2932259 RepID=A0ABY4HCH2_9BACI|nr:S1-like domain-containing RNA-binding protein [Halobacillus amylolyticus]UOR12547.1 S1-like domain-containing RNA-binding protein [Halobacillus amylolyticus]